MKIGNARIGFATNSSSSHSIVFLPGHKFRGNSSGEGFGWNRFVLTETDDKRAYLGHLIAGNLDGLPDWMRYSIAAEVCGCSISEDGYVDHQSLLVLPKDWSGSGLDRDFIVALRAYFERDEVAIFGGNDNDGNGYEGDGIVLDQVPRDDRRKHLVCRRDGDWWTLFNRDSGAKVRISFDPDAADERPAVPELVDIKITDFCPFACPYCYQGSTVEGVHAKASDLGSFTQWCEDNRVFEVAIGGGEPTLHPEFVTILRRFRQSGVVPNFTTRNSAWLRDEELRPAILEQAGAFAVSVSDRGEVERIYGLLKRHGVEKRRCTLHVVMGTMERWEFDAILREAHDAYLAVTLLGYKTTGRGNEFKPKDYGWWLDSVKSIADKGKLPRLGIDTPLAADFAPKLEQAGVPSYLYYTTEGRHSMYLDAVTGSFGASSYDGNLRPVPVTHNRWGHEMPDYDGAWRAAGGSR